MTIAEICSGKKLTGISIGLLKTVFYYVLILRNVSPARPPHWPHLNGRIHGIQDSKEFALELFDALRKRWRLNVEGISKFELHEFWCKITDDSLDSQLQLFFYIGDKDDDGRWNIDDVKEMIKLSASTCKLPRLEEQAEEFATLSMEELDPDAIGYIEILPLKLFLFRKDKHLDYSNSSRTIDTLTPLETPRFRGRRLKAMSNLRTHARKLGDWAQELLSWPKLRVDRKYDVLLLIGLGVGATKFTSILKDLINNTAEHEEAEEKNPVRTTNAYFYWVTREEDSLDLFKGVMNEVADLDQMGIVEMHNYLTSDITHIVEMHEEGDPRSILIAMVAAVIHLKNIFDNGCRSKVRTQFAHPNWENVISNLGTKHPNARIGVFYCGTSTVAKELSMLCDMYNQLRTATFAFHKMHE